MPTIYLDVIWLENFLMDLWILFLAGWFGKSRVPLRRYIGGAAFSALLSLVVFIPGWGSAGTGLLGKALMSLAVVGVTFRWEGLRKYGKHLALFYLASFLTGGVVLAVSFFSTGAFGNLQVVDNRFVWEMNVGVAALFGSIPLLYLAADQMMRAKRQHAAAQLRNQVIINIGGREMAIQAIVDTGNSLTDPFSHEPVSIVSGKAIMGLLPESFKPFYQSGEDPISKLGKFPIDPGFEHRMRLIPFRGVGGNSGMLLGFRPDGWWVEKDGRRLALQGLLALQIHSLSAADSYQMILHPDAVTDWVDNIQSENCSNVVVERGN